MAEAVLVLNAGSSSLKFSVFLDAEEVLVRGQIEGLSAQPHFAARDAKGALLDERTWPSKEAFGHAGAIEFLFAWSRQGSLAAHRLVAAGHRVVHGGARFAGPARIDAGVISELESLVPLAPLHQPHHIAAIRAVAQHAPQLPQVACFDTSFHRTQPIVAQSFALPRRYAQEGVRRYGFHGLSFEYIASVLPNIDERAARGRVVVAHLGNGASMCAILERKSVATTMGFTPLDGLMMGTRCGSIDPGVLLYLMNQHGCDAREIEDLLWHESGLLGFSEISSDMRTLLESRDPRAAEAIDLFVYRIRRELGSLTAALGGLDALVFTGGIGENAAAIRARVCRDAGWLDLELDDAANRAGGPRISRPGSRVAAWVIPTNEELMIARHTRRLLA
jgi:acetate kinase